MRLLRTYTWTPLNLFYHPQVVEFQGDLHDDIIAATSPFLPLMHTWTYQTGEGPPGGPLHINITNFKLF